MPVSQPHTDGNTHLKIIKTNGDTPNFNSSENTSKKLVLSFGKLQNLHLEAGVFTHPIFVVLIFCIFSLLKSRWVVSTIFIYTLYLIDVQVEDIPEFIRLIFHAISP